MDLSQIKSESERKNRNKSSPKMIFDNSVHLSHQFALNVLFIDPNTNPNPKSG